MNAVSSKKCPFCFRQSKIGTPKSQSGLVLFAIGVAFTMAGAVAQAQQPTKIPRIGYLAVNSLSDNAARIDAFRQGLRELGYVEGKNIIIEWRSAEGKLGSPAGARSRAGEPPGRRPRLIWSDTNPCRQESHR